MSLEQFKYILCFDDAIDTAESDLAKYMTVERDVKYLKFKEGCQPTIWHCKRLNREEIRAVRNAGSAMDSNEAAFKRGLMKVERLKFPNGEIRDWFRHDGVSILGDKILESYFSESQIQEVGSAIWQNSILTQGSTAPYVLPATSALEVKGLLLRNAESRKILLELELEKEKLKEQQATPSSKNGEEPISVPVQEK